MAYVVPLCSRRNEPRYLHLLSTVREGVPQEILGQMFGDVRFSLLTLIKSFTMDILSAKRTLTFCPKLFETGRSSN